MWTIGALLLSILFFAAMLTNSYEGSVTAAERLYWSDYLKSGACGQASAGPGSKYTLLEGTVGKGQRLVIGDEIEEVPGPDGRPGCRLTEEGVMDGIARLQFVTGTFNDRARPMIWKHGRRLRGPELVTTVGSGSDHVGSEYCTRKSHGGASRVVAPVNPSACRLGRNNLKSGGWSAIRGRREKTDNRVR